ncbi:Aspartyl aminopeptidase [Camellia lanceoleosa]|uniref:Aspartyl aminopeptidase n=1 Tax=Camellia lanceoleosa TaxID=1840588 RepID=A0ACC0FZ83_9ERIC|nr:Aspartyl aminopeptidase [Camellia lanceoleosa]
MTSLKYLNVGHNQLQGQVNDMFGELSSLSTLAVNNDGFKPNLETHLIPLLATKVLSDELSCGIEDIANIELNVCDTQPSCLGGANNEFIFSGRLDNLASSYCALRALIDSCETPTDLSSEHAIRMIALFDNEEIMRLFPFAGLIN